MSHMRVELPRTGLSNNGGNMCYMNTVVQLLRHTYPLNHYFVQQTWKSELSQKPKCDATIITQQLGELFDCFQMITARQRHCTISPNQFIGHVRNISHKKVTPFADGNQHDIADFMQFILDNMHMALAIPVEMSTVGVPKNREDEMMIESFKMLRRHYASEYSIVVEMLGGQFYQRIQTCDDSPSLPYHQSESYDPFSILQLPIPVYHRKTCTIYDCLKLFIAKDTLQDWKPTDTSPPRLAQKSVWLWALPEILTIQFKRFSGYQFKESREIEIAIELDLSHYCHGYDRKHAKYTLFAVGNHTGNLSMGHYTADCFDFIQKKWYRYDDTNVTAILPTQINCRHAYLLMYQRNPAT
jgi:ubiquitin C-terminal hydrolase